MLYIGLIAKKRKLASIQSKYFMLGKMGILSHIPQLPFKTYEFI